MEKIDFTIKEGFVDCLPECDGTGCELKEELLNTESNIALPSTEKWELEAEYVGNAKLEDIMSVEEELILTNNKKTAIQGMILILEKYNETFVNFGDVIYLLSQKIKAINVYIERLSKEKESTDQHFKRDINKVLREYGVNIDSEKLVEILREENISFPIKEEEDIKENTCETEYRCDSEYGC